jgi:hypothetical protein
LGFQAFFRQTSGDPSAVQVVHQPLLNIPVTDFYRFGGRLPPFLHAMMPPGNENARSAGNILKRKASKA